MEKKRIGMHGNTVELCLHSLTYHVHTRNWLMRKAVIRAVSDYGKIMDLKGWGDIVIELPSEVLEFLRSFYRIGMRRKWSKELMKRFVDGENLERVRDELALRLIAENLGD